MNFYRAKKTFSSGAIFIVAGQVFALADGEECYLPQGVPDTEFLNYYELIDIEQFFSGTGANG